MTKNKAERWVFRLYVTDRSMRSIAALRNLKAICDECLVEPFDVEVIDLLMHPERARAENIVAVPTLIKLAPKPGRRMVGDLSDRNRTLAWLGLPQAKPPKGKRAHREGRA